MSSYPAAAIILLAWGGFYVLMFIGAAIGNGFVAAKLGKSVALWVILSLIPIYNFFFIYYVGYVVVTRVLAKLDEIFVRVESISS